MKIAQNKIIAYKFTGNKVELTPNEANALFSIDNDWEFWRKLEIRKTSNFTKKEQKQYVKSVQKELANY